MTATRDELDAVPSALQDAILAWYQRSGRRLAFRATRDPYAVLVSELMAQQTQAARAADAWTAWMTRFPTVESLATASPADVLRAWAGLGYNRRAVSLQRAARVIMAEHGGRVPDSIDGLMALPGVGPYTARAVAAIAFGVRAGAIDTNIRRVLGRLVAGEADALRPAQLQALADAAVPEGRAGDWTHALMDIGAGPCRPQRPRCAECPARSWCRFAGQGSATAAVPARRERRPQPPFPSTTRWLRGRILARARDAEDGGWVRYDRPIGDHDVAAVRDAVATLASEGLLEVGPSDEPTARLPGAEVTMAQPGAVTTAAHPDGRDGIAARKLDPPGFGRTT